MRILIVEKHFYSDDACAKRVEEYKALFEGRGHEVDFHWTLYGAIDLGDLQPDCLGNYDVAIAHPMWGKGKDTELLKAEIERREEFRVILHTSKVGKASYEDRSDGSGLDFSRSDQLHVYFPEVPDGQNPDVAQNRLIRLVEDGWEVPNGQTTS